MSIPNGLAPGFYNIADILDRRIQDVGADTISDALRLSGEIHQRVNTALFASSITTFPWFKQRYRLGGQRRVQSMTEDSVPKTQRSGLAYDVALPLQIVADAIGLNMWAENVQTVQDISDEMIQILDAFAHWERRTFLAAIMTDTAWVYADDSDDVGNLTIQVLANGATDGQLYLKRDGVPSVSDHYLAQAGAISDADNPYEDSYDVLKTHPTNAGPYVSYISSSLVATTKALANFQTFNSTFVAYGADRTSAANSAESLLGWGNEVIGVVEEAGTGTGMVIVEVDDLPAGYIVTQALGAGPYVGQREETMNEQSLIMRETRPNENQHKTSFFRRAGKGVVNRVAATLTLVGNASYSAPAGFVAPYVGI